MKYIPQSEQDRSDMLETIGVDSIEDLFSAIPKNYRCPEQIDYPQAQSESELRDQFKGLSDLSESPQLSFAGCGIYQHEIPSIVPFLTQRSEFATSYTPYQPEVSQGSLQCIFEFQTLACQLTEMELSNASLYDGATALGEAALMALRIKKKSKAKILVSSALHPFYREVLETYCEAFLDRFEWLPLDGNSLDLAALEKKIESADLLITQSPNVFGSIENEARIGEIKKTSDALWITSCMEPFFWGAFRGPGAFGADIVTAEGQSFGNKAFLGGSSFGIFCCKNEFLRNLPGRLVGETLDQNGDRAFTLTFATREQFIRRGRATSNICTNNNLNMLAGLIHMLCLGRQGLREVALQSISKTQYLRRSLSKISGLKLTKDPVFNEFCIESPLTGDELVERLSQEGVIPGVSLGRFKEEWKHKLLIHVSERHRLEHLDRLCTLIQKSL
ncbi:MAG: aminomethyl-transferring glycine dehydrogenase subunit GcvPA [Bradymonadales bacterium]|nr:MAG: aminomethyl-transferring glycine dehydrogenase subunit GcvPA [Bradymonadales bacterium]